MIGGVMMARTNNISSKIVVIRKQVLEHWNRLEFEAAAEQVLPCCGSRAWAKGMARRRPLLGEEEVLAAADVAWWSCGEADRREAFDCHPRIGESRAHEQVTQRSLAWSRQEQSEIQGEEEDTARLLQEGNRAYEVRFGMTFLVCAQGRSGAEILHILNQRMSHDLLTELTEAAEQQRQITALRLSRWLGGQ